MLWHLCYINVIYYFIVCHVWAHNNTLPNTQHIEMKSWHCCNPFSNASFATISASFGIPGCHTSVHLLGTLNCQLTLRNHHQSGARNREKPHHLWQQLLPSHWISFHHWQLYKNSNLLADQKLTAIMSSLKAITSVEPLNYNQTQVTTIWFSQCLGLDRLALLDSWMLLVVSILCCAILFRCRQETKEHSCLALKTQQSKSLG